MTARHILFVCLGNICRSPTALGVFRAMAARAALQVTSDSAGTSRWHVGAPAHPASRAAALRRGYDLSGLRARRISPADFVRSDLILAMDRKNLRDLLAKAPPDAPPIRLLLSYAPELGREDLPDPWHTGDFDQTLDLVETACARLVDRLRTEGGQLVQ